MFLKIFYLSILLFCLSCDTDSWFVEARTGLHSYKRDIELVFEYKGKEYILRPTIECRLLEKNKIKRTGWASFGRPKQYNWNLFSEEVRKEMANRGYYLKWESKIINNSIKLEGGGIIGIANIFYSNEEAFYYDYAIKKFKELKKYFHKSVNAYYYRIKNVSNPFIYFNKNISARDFKLKNFKINKKY